VAQHRPNSREKHNEPADLLFYKLTWERLFIGPDSVVFLAETTAGTEILHSLDLVIMWLAVSPYRQN
jgi:hypothetical protein